MMEESHLQDTPHDDDQVQALARTNGDDEAHAVGTFTLQPRSLEEAKSIATMLSRSSMIPKAYQGKPSDILVAIAMGHELGLPPIQSLQSIAVINGHPAVYGDGLIGLVRSSSLCEYVCEGFDDDTMTAICIAKRTSQTEERRTFSQKDAEIAGLWSKPGPWKQYPKRMLQMRARAFCLRDLFPDVLKGLAVAEEVVDYVEIHTGHADVDEDTPRTQQVADKVTKAAEKIRKSKEHPSTEQELLPWES